MLDFYNLKFYVGSRRLKPAATFVLSKNVETGLYLPAVGRDPLNNRPEGLFLQIHSFRK